MSSNEHLFLATIHNNPWLRSKLNVSFYVFNIDNFKNEYIRGNHVHNACLFRGLRSDNYTMKEIAEMYGVSMALVHKYVHDMKNPNVPEKLSENEIAIIRRMRERGDGLENIAHMLGRSSGVVYKYTQDIVNERRLNRVALTNTKTGKVYDYIPA
jgi:predicted transcriptional regulator